MTMWFLLRFYLSLCLKYELKKTNFSIFTVLLFSYVAMKTKIISIQCSHTSCQPIMLAFKYECRSPYVYMCAHVYVRPRNVYDMYACESATVIKFNELFSQSHFVYIFLVGFCFSYIVAVVVIPYCFHCCLIHLHLH